MQQGGGGTLSPGLPLRPGLTPVRLTLLHAAWNSEGVCVILHNNHHNHRHNHCHKMLISIASMHSSALVGIAPDRSICSFPVSLKSINEKPVSMVSTNNRVRNDTQSICGLQEEEKQQEERR